MRMSRKKRHKYRFHPLFWATWTLLLIAIGGVLVWIQQEGLQLNLNQSPSIAQHKGTEHVQVQKQSETSSIVKQPSQAPQGPSDNEVVGNAVGKRDRNKQQSVSPHKPINLVFAGDAMMDWSVKETIRKKGTDYPYVHVKSEIEKADYAFVNLETAITTHHVKDTNQLYNFKSDPIALKGLKNAGFDLVSIANNHTLDFMDKGFLDTLRHLEKADLPYVGGGRTEEEAYKAHTVELNGKKVKFLAFSRFIPQTYWFANGNEPGIAEAYNKSSVLPVIKRERKDCDYLLVYMHWGVEKENRPAPWQRTYAKEIIDAGADAIVGSHVHVLQGFEFYKGKPIAYSIGNFLFPNYVKGRNADTGLLHLTLDNGQVSMAFDPYYIKNDQIVKRDSKYVESQYNYLESISYKAVMNANQVEPAIKASR
ncbi:CapA family protein [Paenibacillus arenosi]|nr:CapA family protein [Paenibacillus arenosi]